jgi:predicted RNase H-like HicB family nuclease
MILEWDPEGQIYVVSVPELPGCKTHGKTYAEAARHGQEAIESIIDIMREDGRSLPVPRHWHADVASAVR